MAVANVSNLKGGCGAGTSRLRRGRWPGVLAWLKRVLKVLDNRPLDSVPPQGRTAAGREKE